MGAYKGRVNLKQRRRRFAKAERIRASAATKEQSLRTPAPSDKTMSPESFKPDDDDLDTEDMSLDKTEGNETAVEKEDAEEI